MHPPLPAETIFNAIPFGLIFVEDGTIRHANAQAHTILRRLYLESTPINEIIPDYEHHLRHTVVVENVPALAHIFPMSATTQAVVVRYTTFEISIVHDQINTDILTRIEEVLEHTALVDQNMLTDDQAVFFKFIERTLHSLSQHTYVFLWSQHILATPKPLVSIELTTWLPQRLQDWQIEAQTRNIRFEVEYNQTEAFMFIEEALDTMIDELLTKTFVGDSHDRIIKLYLNADQTLLKIQIHDSVYEIDRTLWGHYYAESLEIVRLWTTHLQGMMYLETKEAHGKTITLEIPLPLRQCLQQTYTTLEHWLQALPFVLDVQDQANNLVWANHSATHNQQIKHLPFYNEIANSIDTSKPIYWKTIPHRPFVQKQLEAPELKLSITHLSTLVNLGICYPHWSCLHCGWNTIAGYSQLLQQGAVGPLDPTHQVIFTSIVNINSQISSFFSRLRTFNGGDYPYYYDDYSREAIDTELNKIVKKFDQICTKRQINLHFEILSFSKTHYISFNSLLINQLLENAIQAAPAGTQVTLRVQKFENGVLFQIHDHGAGIPAAERAQMYDFFWRNPHNYIAPLEEPRLGIGLALANIIVRAADGWMKHEYDTGGTTCSVWLPWIDSHK